MIGQFTVSIILQGGRPAPIRENNTSISYPFELSKGGPSWSNTIYLATAQPGS